MQPKRIDASLSVCGPLGFLPPTYWQAMLRGREWMAKPQMAA